METVIVTMRGSAKFNFSGTNAATVLIDDSSNTRFVVTRRKPTSVYCPFPVIESPAVFDIERRGRSASSTNLSFLVYTNTGSGLQTTTYYRATGDVSGQNIAFAPFATRARVNFTIPESRRLMPEVSVFLQVPSLTNTTHEIRYLPESRFVRLEILSTNAIEGTSTNARLRLSRLVADAAVSATFTLGGAARGPGDPQTVDYNFTSPFAMTIPAQSLSVETSIAGLADGYLEGWESIFVTPDFTATDVSLDFQPPAVLFIREDTADPGSLPGSDFDFDGMPDYWEVANGLDPFAPGEEERDADGDGLTNIEEYRFGTSPRAVDTDANGVNDFRQHVLADDPGPDYVPVRLYTKDTGKVNNGMNCAVCHTTQLKVGDYSLYSTRSANQEPAEKTYWYRKGQSYPIFLREIVATLPPTTNTSGNPTTTALYSASLLPATNAPQAFVVQDPANKLGTNQPWSNFPSNTLTQVATLVVPKIEVSWESYPNNVPLDANTNSGGGLRVFPDRLNPTDEISREFVLIRVKTIPPVPGQPVRLKAFDVDDPTEHPDDVSGVIDSNDSGGVAVGEDNLGIPKFGQLLTDQMTLDNSGEATVPFRVALKPGDNYRIAVLLDTPGATNHLSQLQVNNPSAPFYVSSGTNEVAGFVGGISPMLTVWRKLHLEFDSMTAPPTNGPEALYDPVRIWRVTPNYPSPGRSTLGLILSNVADGLNLYEFGKIEIPGISTNRVLKSNSRAYVGGSRTAIGAEIDGVIPTNAVGLTARLYDDDDRFLNDDPVYRSNLHLQSPPLPADARSGEFVQAMQSSFAQAYIQAVDANAMGWNPQNQRIVPFKRNADLGPTSSPFDENLQLRGSDKPEFWSYSVVLAYQDDTSEDGDPDREEPSLGINADDDATTTLDGFCVVFLEGVRDKEWGPNREGNGIDPNLFQNTQWAATYQDFYLNRLYGAIIHEVGHAPPQNNAFAFDHGEGGLMQKGGSRISEDSFLPKTIRRFRSTTKWTP